MKGTHWRVWLSVSGSPKWAAVRISLLRSVASGDSISRLPNKTKPNPMPFIGYKARDDGQQKSQTPAITAFGFECLGLSGPKVAAEGLELRLNFKGKTYILSPAGDSLGIFWSER